MLFLEQLERQALADRQALLVRGITEDLPTAYSEKQRFDTWLIAEPQTVAAVSPTDLARREELMALGVA